MTPLREVRGDERVDGGGIGDGAEDALGVFRAAGLAPGSQPEGGEPAGAADSNLPSLDRVPGAAPLAEVIDSGIAAAREVVERALDPTAPAANRQRWQSPTWELVSRLRRHPATYYLDADEVADMVESLRPGVWDELPESDTLGNPIDPAEDFAIAWDRCRGGSALERAMLEVDGAPIHSDEFGADPWVSHRRRAGFRRFLALARELTRIAQGGPIVLAVEGIAAALGVDRHAVGEYRRRAVELEYVKEVAQANRHKRKAAEYQWVYPW